MGEITQAVPVAHASCREPSAVGGTGFAKVGGNYAGGMRATKKALER